MTWAMVIVLAMLAFVLVVFVFKAARGAREAVGAVLLLGIAGYAVQGSPAQPGSPKRSAEAKSADSAVLVDARSRVSNRGIPPSNQWVIIADGLARNGRFADAAQVLRGAVQKDPGNSEAWLAMANALMAHADGMLTPASLYAYRRAAKADPDNPGPPFFLGLAMAQAGRFGEARTLWAGLLESSPEDAPWRPLLARQLERIDALMAGNPGIASGNPPPEPAPPSSVAPR